jgi:nicotinate-nucleotide adenylyltransferase
MRTGRNHTVGILGGSFNPPHRGHLALARAVLDRGLVDRVRLIPAASPPHKPLPGVPPEIRLAMTRLLAEEDERLAVDDIELRRVGPSFTVDTLRELRSLHPDWQFRLIIGSDMAKSFATWRSYREILSLAPPLVAERPDSLFPDGDFAASGEDWAAAMAAGRFPMAHVDASSTAVRRLIAEGAGDEALRTLLTGPVLDFVRGHSLYEHID